MSDLVFTTRGVAEVLAAQEKLAEQTGKQKAAARALNEEYRANEAELRKLGRAAQQIYRDNETAQERYNRKLAEAKSALQGNANGTELLRREQERLKKELDEAGKSGKTAGEYLAAAFDPKKLLGYAAGFASISTVVSTITAELRAQQEMIDKRNAAQLSVGESRNVLLRNLVGSSNQEITSALSSATKISAKTGVSEVAINNALASAISATGNVPVAISLTERSASFLKDRPTEIGDFAGALGDLTRVTGTNDPNVALGLLATIGKLSRPISPQQTAQSLAPAMLGTLPFGGSARSTGALYSALTTGSGDFTGLHTKTGVVALAEQLQEASLAEKSFAGTSTKPGFAPGELQGRDMLDRIRFLQHNPALAKKFLDLASFERTVIGPITQLLRDPSSRMAQDFDVALQSIGSNQQLQRTGLSTQGMFGRYNLLEPVAERSRGLSSALERLQTRKASEYLSSQDIENIRALTLESGGTNLGNQFDTLLGRIKGGGKVRAADAIDILQGRISSLEHPTYRTSAAAGYGAAMMEQSRAPTQEEKDSAAKLKETVDLLKDSVKEQRETNRILRTKPPMTWGSN